MRKIILTPYKCEDGEPYQVKKSIVGLLFAPQLMLSSRGIIDHDRIAKLVESANGAVLLEDADYDRVKTAIETFSGYSRSEVELVKRVLEAETVTVQEAPVVDPAAPREA
jgi:hypothetical protein